MLIVSNLPKVCMVYVPQPHQVPLQVRISTGQTWASLQPLS